MFLWKHTFALFSMEAYIFLAYIDGSRNPLSDLYGVRRLVSEGYKPPDFRVIPPATMTVLCRSRCSLSLFFATLTVPRCLPFCVLPGNVSCPEALSTKFIRYQRN